MSKRTLWYVCLSVLCCVALAFVVNASAVNSDRGIYKAEPTVGNMKVDKVAALAAANAKIKEAMAAAQAQAHSPAATEATPVAPSLRQSLIPADVREMYARWLANGTATPEEKELIARYYFATAANDERNPLDNQGGPDAFGYRYVDNQAGDTATFAWIELCGDGSASDGPSGDDAAANAAIGWTFPFYGGSYTAVNISTNGMLSFTTANSSFSNACVGTNNPPAGSPQILPYWDDLYASGDGGCTPGAPWIRYRNFGSYFVVEWKTVNYCCGNTGAMSFEAILFPDGKVKVQYNTDFDNAGTNGATVGIDASGTGNGLEYVCNAASIAGGRAIWFYPGPASNGRCCYNGGNSCADNLPADCAALGGTWTGGLTCAANPCPVTPPNDNCSSVTPVPCPINTTGDNTLATMDGACLGTGLPETWHAFTISQTSTVTITECGQSGNWQDFYWAITPDCPCTSYILRDTWTFPDPNCPNGGIIFTFNALPAGTYYVPILQDASLGAIGAYSLSITCTPVVLGRCCYNQNCSYQCGDFTQAQCTSLGGTWDQTLTCVNDPCPPPPPCTPDFVINAPGSASAATLCGAGDDCCLRVGEDLLIQINIPADGLYSIEFCQPDGIAWDSYAYLTTACCDGNTLIAASDDDCQDNSTGFDDPKFVCIALTAGTYYVDFESFSSGDCAHPMSCVVTACAPHKCCYGSPQNPTCVDTSQAGCAALGGVYDASTTCAQSPCQVCDVVPNGVQEATEAQDSTNGISDPNGGCNNLACGGSDNRPVATCGQTLSGQMFYYTGPVCAGGPATFRDTDWYNITLVDSDSISVTVTTDAPGSDAIVYIFQYDCNIWNGVIALAQQSSPCVPFTAVTPCLGPGIYTVFVAPAFTGVWTGTADYNLTIQCIPCGTVCEPATELTVLRALGPAGSVNIRWNATQTIGNYKVWRTANKNNDYDPNNGADPDWTLIASVPAPGAPGVLSVSDTPLGAYYNYTVTHDCTPTGRCCYGANQCATNTLAECTQLSGAWTAGLNCVSNPCPVTLQGDDACGAANPLLTNGQTINGTNVGATTDGTWPCAAGGADVWYRYTGNAAGGNVTISLCGSGYDTAVMVLDACGGTNLACNDDFCGLQSTTSFVAAPNTTYWVAVGGFASSTGNFTVLLTQ